MWGAPNSIPFRRGFAKLGGRGESTGGSGFRGGCGVGPSGSGPPPKMAPVPDSPPLSAQLPSLCARLQAPRADGAQYDELTRGQ